MDPTTFLGAVSAMLGYGHSPKTPCYNMRSVVDVDGGLPDIGLTAHALARRRALGQRGKHFTSAENRRVQDW
jgi:hypothetical protein